MKPRHWRPTAVDDADAAALWYSVQGGVSLELAFIDALDAATDLIARHPDSGSTRHAGLFPELPLPLRFIVLRRFDRYLVYYLDLPDYVDIIRVWDASRGLQALGESAVEKPP
ncbi:MAG: type II toxin-antitoxin system RelE/ParE family toxin [Lysobacter sp.]|nr:type II toxin-antitoxin system RelE/ParE family toxin [Lysobacter sp.]